MSDVRKLSLIVTIVDSGEQLRGFLGEVMHFDYEGPVEVIVPYDQSIAEIAAMAKEFPGVRFLDIGAIVPERPITTEAGQHELYDRRRAAGLAAATGDIIGILEERGWPRRDWARRLMQLHAELGHNVIGGAIECREPVGLLNWAVYVTDFGRYARPFDSGPVAWVSDVNVSYSRKALEDTRPIWSERFHEPLVHSYFLDRGEALYLSSDLVVFHGRAQARLGSLLIERFHWGRLFGKIRAMQFTPGQRLKYILASPAIAPLLWLRHGLLQRKKGRGRRYLKALPFVMILSTVWVMGEVWGYITRRA
ncbi:hypothetical protein OEZ71_13380 [Defluviimonas sp. WL0050]|uniref:Uncharacterized protein n=1 Tax=Albidovulum litorale TaxID=2984134 RepID=A0ABT2ZRA4_9RHOB|nr:hypothetical protein [Defluviimonas sp. WL0050]MCV2873286.1 hypothetical protein [Defluviimonas sp. WL0050]